MNGQSFPDGYTGDQCYRCGCFIGKKNIINGKLYCCKCADWWNNREHRPNGFKPHWITGDKTQ